MAEGPPGGRQALPASLSPHCQKQYLRPETAGSRGARILGQSINENLVSLGALLIPGAVQVGTGTTFNTSLSSAKTVCCSQQGARPVQTPRASQPPHSACFRPSEVAPQPLLGPDPSVQLLLGSASLAL